MTNALEREMQRLKEMGITVSVSTSHRGIAGSVASQIKTAAKDAGIHYGEPDDEWPGVER